MTAPDPERPDWLVVLDAACEASSQARVARQVRYSTTVISQVRNGRYLGDLAAVETAVRGALMGKTVQCPVLREITTERCVEAQRARVQTHNHMRVKLYRACRSGCPHARIINGGAKC